LDIPHILSKYQVAALSMLVSALLVLGDAAQNNEVTAALTGGISLRRLVRMPALIAAGLAVVMFLVQDTVGAAASRQIERLESRYFSRNVQNRRPPITWPHLANQWTCHVMKFNRAALTGERVLMHSFREDAVEQIMARRIYWDEEAGQWLIEDGGWLVIDPRKEWQGPVNRITQQAAPIAETPEELFALDEPAEGKSLMTLLRDIRRAVSRGIPVRAQWAEWHAKFSQPALCFIIIWLAIPFAMRLRRGGLAIGFGVSVAVALAYLILFRVSMGLGHAERLSPPIAAWLANVFFLIVGIVLFRKTPT
jgi:lipopolysaccharide export system permease protein